MPINIANTLLYFNGSILYLKTKYIKKILIIRETPTTIFVIKLFDFSIVFPLTYFPKYGT